MAASKLVFLLLFSTIFGTPVFTKNVIGDSAANSDSNDVYPTEISDASLKIKLDHLNSKISILELKVDERANELKRKDENIKQLENIILEKSTSVNSLKGEVQLLQEKGSLDAKYQVVKAYARAGDLEKQVDSLKKKMETQTKRKSVLESRLSIAEKKVQDLNHKLENLQRINDEQKNIIHKTERALKWQRCYDCAHEEMVKAKLEAADISKEVREARQSLIPLWLAVHLVHSQSFIITQWNERGRPTLDTTIQKALEMKAQIEIWVEPHIDTIKTQWIPTIEEWWVAFVTNIEPSVQLLTAKTVDVYHASKKTVEPHIVKVQKTLDPYFMEAEKFARPHVNHVSIMMKPHVDKACVFLKPYTTKVYRGYKKFMKAVPVYHRQVRVTIRELLKSHEFTKPIATNEVVWYMVSALMALPVIIFFNLTSAIFQ